jgi:hypothetical protein
MSYEDFLQKHQILHRTRLFTDEWKVAQKWISFQVPWKVDYSKTKFSFKIEKKTSVVIVLSKVRQYS